MSYDPLSEKKLKSYQFMKYHSFGAFTPVNILPTVILAAHKPKYPTTHIIELIIKLCYINKRKSSAKDGIIKGI